MSDPKNTTNEDNARDVELNDESLDSASGGKPASETNDAREATDPRSPVNFD